MARYMRMTALLVLLALVQLVLAEDGPRSRANGGRRLRNGGKKAAQKCSAWTFTKCMPAAGRCGKGTKIGSREGDSCMVKQRTFKCNIPCEEINREGRGGKKKKACRYTKAEWGDCVAGSKSRTLTLRRGDTMSCEATKTQTKKCKDKNNKNNKKNQKKGDKDNKDVQRCKYSVQSLSPCDVTSDTQNVTLLIKDGSPTTCSPTQTVTRKCTRTCRYAPGNWSACDAETKLKTRTDKLDAAKSKGVDCKPERSVTKMCKQKRLRCRYQKGEWSQDCDVNNERTLMLTVMAGQSSECPATKEVKKPCTMKTGRERCFFGPWGDFGPCRNGVRTKIRPLMAGNDEACERKAVKTKMC